MTIAFDCDDTLTIPAQAAGTEVDIPNYENIAVYRWFQAQGHHMIIWSGGGKEYAEMWARKLGLTADEILSKEAIYKDRVDIAFDDCIVDLAKVNVKVKRHKNKVVRYPDRVKKDYST